MPFIRPAQTVIDEVESSTRPAGMSAKVHQAVMGRAAQKTAPSLKPGPEMMEAAATGQPQACAIRDAWQFQYPVTMLKPEAYQALVSRTEGITWNG